MEHIRFAPAPEYLAKLEEAIRDVCGSRASHVRTWMGVIHEAEVLWSGSVEVYDLPQPAAAERAFAWGRVENGGFRCYVVLQKGGVQSPRDAVRHAMCTGAPTLGSAVAAAA